MAGGSSVYYNLMEKIGIPKRQILVDRVEAARRAQQATKPKFASALKRFLAVTKVRPSELKDTSVRLNDKLKRCAARAKEVRDRVTAIDRVAQALFKEWSVELTPFSNQGLPRCGCLVPDYRPSV